MSLNLFYRRLTQEDMNDAPKGSWKEKLLYALNLFMQQVYSLFNNGLTPEVNCIAQTKTFRLVGSATPADNVFSFASSFAYFPLGYDLLNVQPTDGSNPIFAAAPFVSWTFLNGQIKIIGISGLTAGVPYTFTIRFWWNQISNQG